MIGPRRRTIGTVAELLLVINRRLTRFLMFVMCAGKDAPGHVNLHAHGIGGHSDCLRDAF